jgi:Spy/CpxP family protein refolding chaperone
MTYATQQLTNALQELTSRSHSEKNDAGHNLPYLITSEQLDLSKEVEAYLEQKQDYSQRTRAVSIGSY